MSEVKAARQAIGSFAKDFADYAELEPVDASELQIRLEELVMKIGLPAPAWSQEAPKVPGWYWYESNGVLPCCVEVAWWNGHPLVAFFISGRRGRVEEIGGSWAGPIVPPEGTR